MDFYFFDRSFGYLGTATTDDTPGTVKFGNDQDVQSVEISKRVLTATLFFDSSQSDDVATMAAGGNFLLYKDNDGESVFMEITHTERSPKEGTQTIQAEDAGIDLIDETVGAYAADDAYTIDFYLDEFTSDSGWSIGANEIPNTALKLTFDTEDETALARILEVAEGFGVELSFSFTFVDGVLTKFIDIHKKRGSDTDAELIRDFNVDDLITTTDITGLFTSVKAKADTHGTNDKPITLKGHTWQSSDGRYVLGSDGILRDTEAVKLWSRGLYTPGLSADAHHLQRVKTYTTGIESDISYSQYPEEIESKSKDITAQKKKITSANTQIANQQKYIANKNMYISQCNARIKTYQARITQYNADIAKLKTESQTATVVKSIASKQKSITNNNRYIPNQKTYIANANTAIKGYNKKIAEYKADIVKYNKQISTDNADIASMNAGSAKLLSKVQSKLLNLALADLKAHNTPAVSYEIEGAVLPDGVRVGDRVHLADPEEGQYIETRLLTLTHSYSMGTVDATFGEFVKEQSGISPELQAIADTLRATIKQTYTWIRYADDDQGTGISPLAAGKAYIAMKPNQTDAVPSDDPADYVGLWQKVTGDPGKDGGQGTPGTPGADGKTSYIHTAWADSVDGTANFSTSEAGNRLYIGTVTDFTEADPTDPTAYTWQYVKGEVGHTGADGQDGKDGLTSYLHTAYAQNSTGTLGFSTTSATGATYIGVYSDQTAADSTVASKYTWMQAQGPAGKDITSFAKGTALPSTVGPANSQFWLTNADGQATAVYVSNGTSWVATPITASMIVAATFKGMNFEGVTFTGSSFSTSNSYKADGSDTFTSGATITNTQTLDSHGYKSLTKGAIMGSTVAGSYTGTTTIDNAGRLIARSDFSSGDWSEMRVDPVNSSFTATNSFGQLGQLGAWDLQALNDSGKLLWQGGMWMLETQSITPSKPLSDCLNGWIILWSRYTNGATSDAQFVASFVPKYYAQMYSGKGMNFPLSTFSTNKTVTKMLLITDTKITGHATNGVDPQNEFALRAVLAN
ncbi:phage tail protein [Lacticaseibacillus yichunensis]|uniref:Phage tail protein n=1 Tax=Lacticaseibacillus yichunensis TaxID=2486015 RepID=A0ABW4CNS6_9LACO|nr:phage tail protein [Lacticaseibacillus yichunensis]